MRAPYDNEKRPTKAELEKRFEEAERALKEGPFKTERAARAFLREDVRSIW